MAAAKKLAPDALLSLIAERAPALREAGVTSLTFDGVVIQLAPYDPPQPVQRSAVDEGEPSDPMENPATYGIRDGGALPGFKRPRSTE